MNALDMANLLDVTYGHYTEQEAEMLRKQHEAIVKLREALVYASTYVQEDEVERGKPYLAGQVIRKALKDTEEFK